MFGVPARLVCRHQGDEGHLLEENKWNTVRGSKGCVSHGPGRRGSVHPAAGCCEHPSSQGRHCGLEAHRARDPETLPLASPGQWSLSRDPI